MASERVFTIRIIGDTSQAEKAFKALLNPLGSAAKACEKVGSASGEVTKAITKDSVSSSVAVNNTASQWISAAGRTTAGMYMLKRVIGTIVTELGDLEDTIVRTSIKLERQGISARLLATDLMQLGLNTNDLLKSVAGWEKAGIIGETMLKDLAVDTNKLSYITGETTEKLTESLGALATSWRKNGEEMKGVMSMLSVLSAKYGVSSESAIRAANSSSVYAQSLGISLETTLAFTGVLERSAVTAGAGASAVNQLMDQMGNLTTMSRNLRAAGILHLDKQLAKGDIAGAILSINKAMQRTPKDWSGRLRVMKLAGFTPEMVTMFQRAAERLGEIKKMQDELNEAQKNGAALEANYGDVMASLAGQFKLLMVAFDQLKMRVMVVLGPILTPIVAALRAMAIAITAIPKPVFALTAGLIGLYVIMLSLYAAASGLVRIQRLMQPQFVGGKTLVEGYARATLQYLSTLRVVLATRLKELATNRTKLMLDILMTNQELASVRALNTSNLLHRTRNGITLKEILYTKLASLGFFGKAAAENVEAGAAYNATAAQWSLNAAMDANPIGAVIVLITALVAGFYLLYKMLNSTNVAVETLGYTLLFIASVFFGGLGIGLVIVFLVALIKHWKDFVGGIKKGFADFKEGFGWFGEIFEPFTDAIHEFKEVWNDLMETLGMGGSKFSFLYYLFRGLGWLIAGLVVGPLKVLMLVFTGIVRIVSALVFLLKELFSLLPSWLGGPKGKEKTYTPDYAARGAAGTRALHEAEAQKKYNAELSRTVGHQAALSAYSRPAISSNTFASIPQYTATSVSNRTPSMAASTALAGYATDGRVAETTAPLKAATVSLNSMSSKKTSKQPIVLQIDGRVLAQVVADIENGELIRFHNAPDRAGYGIPAFA